MGQVLDALINVASIVFVIGIVVIIRKMTDKKSTNKSTYSTQDMHQYQNPPPLRIITPPQPTVIMHQAAPVIMTPRPQQFYMAQPPHIYPQAPPPPPAYTHSSPPSYY